MHVSSGLGPNDREVYEALAARGQPLSAYAILEALRHSGSGRVKAPVQVYRALDKLLRLGEVHRIASLNAFVVCTCRHAGSPPGFLVCTRCGASSEFDAGAAAGVPGDAAGGFKVQSVNLELSGLCSGCQSAGGAA